MSPVVLLMAYGSPNNLDEVKEYLSQIRGGRVSGPEEIEQLTERYRRVGGRTPLFDITMAQARALEKSLAEQGQPMRVYVGMKHWHPFIEQTVKHIVASGTADSIIGIALAPHYSRLSIGGYEDAINRGLADTGTKIPIRMVKSWHTEPHLIRELSDLVANGLAQMRDPNTAVILFTAHSLPKRAVQQDDPYYEQLLETSSLVASAANTENWRFAFQSMGVPREDWLGPQIRESIEELSHEGVSEVLVCPVGFVSDHLEILYDLDIEAREYAKSLGIRLERTKSLNASTGLIEALASTVSSSIERYVAA